MDVLRELRWARWGPMEVREVDLGAGPVKVLTPRSGHDRRKGYDLYREGRSLLDDLVEAADSAEHREVLWSAVGAGEVEGAKRFRQADAILERDIAAAASRWGFLKEQVHTDTEDASGRLFEFLGHWRRELLDLRQAWDLFRAGGNLSSIVLALYAHNLLDGPAEIESSAEVAVNEHGFQIWKTGPAARALRPDRRAEGARGLLEQALSRQLSRGDVEVVLKGSRYLLRPTSLIAAAWLELGDRVLRARPERTCPQCGGAFVPLTARRVFCSEKCKDDAKNARRSKAKRRTR